MYSDNVCATIFREHLNNSMMTCDYSWRTFIVKKKNSSTMETNQMLSNRWMDNGTVVYLLHRTLLSHKSDEIILLATKWSQPGSIMLSKLRQSQREKRLICSLWYTTNTQIRIHIDMYKYICIYTHIWTVQRRLAYCEIMD